MNGDGMARTWQCRVLIVEDEPLIAMDIESTLESLGCSVVGPIAQLSEAIEQATRGSFDCAILDINICGGHTHSVIETLLDRGLPVLLASGYSEWTLPARLAVQPRLMKPFTSNQLEREIRMLRDRVVKEE